MKNTSQQLIEDRIKDLRENTDFVSTLLESLTGYAIIAADFDGNIIAFNEGAREIYGYAPEEIIGKQIIEIFFPRDFVESAKLQVIVDDLIGKGRFSYEGEKVRKNGEIFPAQILFTLTKDKKGKVVGFIEIVEDLTPRRQAEKAQAEARASAARIEQLERELHSLEQFAVPPEAAITAHAFGLKSLSQAAPDTFNNLVERYVSLMDLALEQRAYKVEHNISEGLRSLSEEIGFVNGGPRDVVDIHGTALRIQTKDGTSQKSQAYAEEGRLMVLELMGYLASYYRNYASGFARTHAPATTATNVRKGTREGGKHG